MTAKYSGKIVWKGTSAQPDATKFSGMIGHDIENNIYYFSDGASWLPAANWSDSTGTGLVDPQGRNQPMFLTLDPAATAAAASANVTSIQSALDAGGLVRLYAPDGAYINSTLRIGGGTTLELVGQTSISALGAVGSLLTTKAFADAGTTVTVSWSSGMTASVSWTAHGRSVGDYVWLNRADQAQFCGVFRVITISDANTFVVRLRRLPSTTATGTIIGRVAHQRVSVVGGTWNYNATGGNTGTGSALHAIVLAGVHDLEASNLSGADTSKYFLCLGAVSQYKVNNIRGNTLASDVVKVYGPAFGGDLSNIGAGSSGDDFLSFQTREPAAFVAYDFCHGDVIGAEVRGLYGSSATGSVLIYLSPHGIADGINVDGSGASISATTPQVRVETLYTTGTSEAGTITLSNFNALDGNTLLSLGSGTGFTVVRNLVIQNPLMRHTSSLRRLIDIQGSAVVAQINVYGGWLGLFDNFINCGTNAQTISLSVHGTRLAGGVNTFRAGTAGTLNLSLHDLVLESAASTSMISAPAGTAVLNLRSTGITAAAAPVVSMGAGSSLRLSGPCALSLDGALIDSTVANHAAGASFYNTNGAFGAGVGAYVRGSASWVRVAS